MSTQIQNFYEATITRNWTSTTGDFNVSVAPSISEGIIVISPSSRTLREIVRFTATGTNAYGPFITVSNIAHRGLGGTTAQSHTIGEKVRMNITAEHWTEMQEDINSIVAAGLPAGAEGDIIYNDGADWIPENFNSLSDTYTNDKVKVATVELSSTDILAGYVTPKTLISAPGVGKLIVVDSVVYSFTAGTQYTGGGAHQIRYNGDTNDLVNTGATTYKFTNASNFIYEVVPISSGIGTGVVMTAGINKAVEWSNATGAYATGNGTAKIFIKYRILTL